ncbi:HAD family hydrolase [Paenibacillus polymyxa]|uniref:HAD family hydrolase n=1 Tax=Paenibacillus polymyxa TaxID=1406 RepID=UPI002AB5880C|nr:HAD family hydrolase [Paenibacillus polymyxa]MDY7992502.1 HAD family hydrolase [Paenibacillus polymyxa]MDY8118944.1 HAD family hydrolase [Paenibacillus polymyxa]
MSIEAIIFDLDNTLIHRKQAFAAYTECFIERFIVAEEPAIRAAVVEQIRLADQDGYRDKRELYTELHADLELKNPDTSVQEMLGFWYGEFHKFTVLMDGAKEVLSELRSRGLKLGIITNGSLRTQQAKIDRVMLREYVDSIIVSGGVNIQKPNPRIFELALNELGIVDPGHACYVGDHPTNDIRGAQSAGLHTIWLEGFITWQETGIVPDYQIGSLREITGWLDRRSYSTNKEEGAS